MLAIAACEPNAAVSRRLGRGLGTVRSRRKRFTPDAWPRCATAINMMTVQFASLLPDIRINLADPGLTATDLSGGQGHSVHDGTDAIIAYALAARGGPAAPLPAATAPCLGNSAVPGNHHRSERN
ncbi:MAG: hypothetical protein ACRDND_29730 [Streptosporangiaceae bacterium]